MWGRRRKRGAQLSRQLALGLLEDAMGRVQQPQDEAEATAYPGAVPPPAAPPGTRDPAGLRAADVPVDNSAGPAPDDDSGPRTPLQRELPAQRTGESTRHGTFG
jgi:hypothetical protein